MQNYAPDALQSSVTINKPSCDINVPCEGAQMKNSDVALIQRVLAGDDDAFSVLVRKYQKQVHALAWRKIGDFHIAEEITQDTFLNAYKRLTTLKEPQRFASWLYVIAANRCSSWLRKKRLPIQSMEHLNQEDQEQLEKAVYSEFVVEENERISGEAQRDVVKKLLAKLGESERTVVTLHYFGEMSCAEIGAFMGVSANTVKSRLRRAQQRLQKEETVIREALDNFKITPHLTDDVMREISRIKPATPTSNKPFVPWAVAASTLAVVLLMLGFGNSNFLTRFQKPYSFDATAEIAIEIIDAPIVANLESKLDVRTQAKNAIVLVRQNDPENQQDDNSTTITEDKQKEETVKDYTQWELPNKAKKRLGKGRIREIQFSPNGKQLAVGTEIGVWMYDVETGQEISLLPGRCESFAFSPDGRFFVNGGGDPSSSIGGTRWETGLQLWEIDTGQKVTLHEPLPAASELWFSDDSKTLGALNKAGDTIYWVDTDTGKSHVKKFENRRDSHPRDVYALTHDKVAIAEDSGILELWNSETGEKVSTLTGPAEKIQAGGFIGPDSNRVISLAFSPDGTHLATGRLDRSVRLWDTSGNSEPIQLQKQSLSEDLLRSHQELVGGPDVLLFSPDGKILACGADQHVKLWDTITGELITTFTAHIGFIEYLAFSTDGSMLASASQDGTIKYWNINTGKPITSHITRHTPWIKGTAFLNNSSKLVCVDISGIITIWDLETSQITTHRTKTAFENTRRYLESEPLGFSPDGTQLVSRGILNTPTAPLGITPLIRLIDINTGRELNTLAYLNENFSDEIEFSPDGKTIAFGVHSHTYGKIRLWNTETDDTFDIQFSDRSNWIRAMVFSPDGNRLATGTREGKVQMWDMETGVELTTFIDTPPAESGSILDLTFSSDGALLAVVYQKQIRLIGRPNRPHFKEVSAGAYTFWQAVFSPDNTVLILSIIGGGIQLRDVATGEVLTTLEGHTASPYVFSFSPDGKTLVSAGYDGSILLWDWEEVSKDSIGKD